MFAPLNRRRFLATAAAGSLAGWLGALAARAADDPQRRKSCILLWMTGGPSHIDTFDLKPEAPANYRGEFRPIATAVPGIDICEHLPQLAGLMQHAAVIRSMQTVEADHTLASYHVHTGYQKRGGGLSFPSLGSIASMELGRTDASLPNFVCIGPASRDSMRSGFLGPKHQPLDVLDPDRGVDNLQPLTGERAFDRQLRLRDALDRRFQQTYRAPAAEAHATVIDGAVRLMRASQIEAFDLSREPDAVRQAYGRSNFSQGCLLARRLIEAGVPFVEVTMGQGSAGWDTHQDNFPRTRALCREIDAPITRLINDLDERGLLESTLIVWMGEFGRTPQITSGGGRNHWARAWSTVLFGGGVRGGQVIGRTDARAEAVVERPVSVSDLLATVCTLLDIDYTKENIPPGVDRPVPIVDAAHGLNVIREVL